MVLRVCPVPLLPHRLDPNSYLLERAIGLQSYKLQYVKYNLIVLFSEICYRSTRHQLCCWTFKHSGSLWMVGNPFVTYFDHDVYARRLRHLPDGLMIRSCETRN